MIQNNILAIKRAFRRSLRIHILVALGAIVLAASILVGIGIAAFVYSTEQASW